MANKPYNIYVGTTARPDYSNKPFVIPEKWKPILALAYAYTTNSLAAAGFDIASLQNAINHHTDQITSIYDNLRTLNNTLGILEQEGLIDDIVALADKISYMDPDEIRNLAYSYAQAQDEIIQAYSYAYSYFLYENAVTRSYENTLETKNELQHNIDLLDEKITNEYVTYSYADATYAHKEDIPTNVSQLENDKGFITHAALNDYVSYSYVDSRIKNIINAAPASLDTLGEIAAALGDDSNLATNLTNQIAQKADLSYVTEQLHKTSAQHDDIPVYDETKKQALIDSGELPDKFLEIRNPEHLTELSSNDEGTYLEIIFSTLRKLQQEVSRLQRTFDKGIISMVDEQTRMSEINSEYADVPEEEPMWAIDPDSLTEITGAEFYTDNAHTLEPAENVLVDSEKLNITGTAFWSDNRLDFTSGDTTNYIHDNLDSKQYVYITASNPKIKVYLTNYEDDVLDINKQIIVDFNNLGISWNEGEKYNILLCISRALNKDLKHQSKDWVGNNFIYVSVGDYYEGRTVKDGYYIRSTESLGTYTAGLLGPATQSGLKQNRYYISRVEFTDLELYRMKFYSKFQDFGNDVQAMVPDDDDTYSVAHITIRSVKNLEQLKKIKNQLLENELIYNDNNNCIYIIKNNEIKLISGGSSNIDPSDDEVTGMERNEILQWLESNGIIGLTLSDDEVFEKLTLNPVGDITFINQLDEKYKFAVDTDGNLRGSYVNTETFAEKLANVPSFKIVDSVDPNKFVNTRGFIGTYNEYRLNYKTENNTTSNYDKDMRLDSDRIKIGNIYAPFKDSKVFGCTHGYIELENTSDQDYPLDGFYIHFARRIAYGEDVQEYSLPLSGVIYAGSTYLIRCKKYSDISQSNTFIDVDSFDIEWITADSVDNNGNIIKGKLLDLSLGIENTFLLTYGCPGTDRSKTMTTIDSETGNIINTTNTFSYKTVMLQPNGTSANTDYIVYHPCYVDSVSILANINGSDSSSQVKNTWCGWPGSGGIYLNDKNLDALYKTTFELDPAKQAYQSLHWNKTTGAGKDSSRVRSNTATDYQTVYLQKEFIEFPKSNEVYPVAMYKPMASYLRKNVCTDKTKLDLEKPNSTTVSFGINMYKTRCFNWVSTGEFDEYVWLRKRGSTEWKRFESYKKRSMTNIIYSYILVDNEGNPILDDKQHEQIMTKIVGEEDKVYNDYRALLNNSETLTYPYRKEFTLETNNAVYARIKQMFPGTELPGVMADENKRGGIRYTAHKCIIEVVKDPVTETTVYEYVVGRADKNMNPDPNHTTEIMTFTLYPTSYVPRLYQTTDQQGFHWIEYQTWAASALKLNEIIDKQQNIDHEEIIPVILNTGDATQNGTRYNEWIDYYIGGKCLFNHLEQMSIVGNNDLCGTDPEILGTGDDDGKSNGFYHHVFYCYEVDEKLTNNKYIERLEKHNSEAEIHHISTDNDLTFDDIFSGNKTDSETNEQISFKYLPLIKGNDNIFRYVPSFYWFGTPDKYTFVMMNSELTYTNCGKWFKRTLMNEDKEQTVNLYTGWTIPAKNEPDAIYDDNLTTIYTMLYNVISEHIEIKKKGEPTYVPAVINENTNEIITEEKLPTKIQNLIVACHEMPFTVVTAANLKFKTIDSDRSLSDGKLVGSHMNMMSNLDKKSNYWFSRLLEHFNVKFVYGGHKHTYAITNELRENYLYTIKDENDNDVLRSSLFNGKMKMEPTLKKDTVLFKTKLKYNGSVQDGTIQVNPTNAIFDNDIYDPSIYNYTGETSVMLSKFPLMKITDDINAPTYSYDTGEVDNENNHIMGRKPYLGINMNSNTLAIYPYYGVEEDIDGIIYMMCQATGFKLKSNKELPGQDQRFSFIIPQTNHTDSGDKPNANQQHPMFTEIHPDTREAYLLRFENIHDGKNVLQQDVYGAGGLDKIVIKYLYRNRAAGDNMFGKWSNTKKLLLSW